MLHLASRPHLLVGPWAHVVTLFAVLSLALSSVILVGAPWMDPGPSLSLALSGAIDGPCYQHLPRHHGLTLWCSAWISEGAASTEVTLGTRLLFP